MGRFTDYSPNQIIRLIQHGLIDKVLDSNMIWLCSSCEICGARCPNGINMAEVMDCLKAMAISKNIVSVKNVKKFHDSFLGSVKLNGRVHEATMMMTYKIKTMDLFSDIDLGMKMFVKGKLHILPKRTKDRARLSRVFTRTANKQK
ncbi:MAG: heterodisulfide reductase [Peptococcaceae bacterium]|nr:heterodisulfide reductase [Peptococcaceae bacterium]